MTGGELERILQTEVEEGFFTKGAQVTVLVGGKPKMSVAVGDAGTGAAMAADTVFRVYCTIKPLTAVAIANEVDAGRLHLDEPLADHLPDIAAVADGLVTLRHVLTHTAGLHRPMALELELVAPEKRSDHLAATPRPRGWPVGRQAAYSEIFGWHLLGRLLERVTSRPLERHLRETLLDPLGLTDTWVGMTLAEHAALLPRLGVSFDMRTHKSYPLLLERGARMCTEVNPAHGGYTTSADLARFYAVLLDQLTGAEHSALPSSATLAMFTSSEGPPRFDAVLDRECEYGLGFMTGLAGHAFGRWCSPASFGHSGNVGSSFAFADPARNLAVGVIFNGVVDHESAFLRRPVVVRAIYAGLDAQEIKAVEADPPAANALTDANGLRPRRRRFGLRR